MKKAYFAGGCFWCVTPLFLERGAVRVVCGYAGGDEISPVYEEVKRQQTGHRETVRVEYDPGAVSYENLLDVFLSGIDPFDGEGQFIDRGFSYSPAIFCQNDGEKRLAEKAIAALEASSGKKVRVAVLPYQNFYEAEEYHQNYFQKNPEAFERELIESGRKKPGGR